MNAFDALFCAAQEKNIHLTRDEPMSRRTTLKFGGPAALFCELRGEEQLLELWALAREFEVPLRVVGNGSNIIVRDGGLPELVVHMGSGFADVSLPQPEVVHAQAGAAVNALALFCARHALTGAEFAYGIPATVGGAVYMNAGAYGGEFSDIVRSVRVLDEKGEIKTYEPADLQFSYRHSRFHQSGEIVLSAEFLLKPGDPQKIDTRMKELMQRRKSKQPLEYPSAGSTFKRPEGEYAAELIERCGLKGLRVGDAAVSEKHSGFLINLGGATCKDFLTLMETVNRRVYEQTGILLEPEPKILGKD